MSNILEMAEEIGRKQGIEQGIVIGMRTLMERNSCSAEEAVDAFQISQEERWTYLNLLEG